MAGPLRETLKQAGYEHVEFVPGVGHILRDVGRNDSAKLELWVARKNHASYGIIYKNTHLEFVRSC
jgi:hypothetical protein